MSYCQTSFVERDKATINTLITKNPFATLLSNHQGNLEISHLPFIYDENEGENGCLYAHFARANRHWKAMDAASECVIVFQGPHSYISPHWYEKKAEDHIPTWNYAVVHAHGSPQRIADKEKLFWQMNRIYESHEKNSTLLVTEEEKSQLFAHVVLFRIAVTRFESIFKLSQNRSEGDAQGAIEGLANSLDTQKIELSQMMQVALSSRTQKA